MKPQSTSRKFLECEGKKLDPHFYHQLLRSFMQIATRTRLNISLTVRRHWIFARRVEDYLKTFQDSVHFLSSDQRGPVTNPPMPEAAKKADLDPAFSFVIWWSFGNQRKNLSFMLCLRESQKCTCKMLSTLPTK